LERTSYTAYNNNLHGRCLSISICQLLANERLLSGHHKLSIYQHHGKNACPCEETLALLQARQPPSREVVYATLSSELGGLPREFILVLDDYHTLRGVEVHNLLGELMCRRPRSLHLVLISCLGLPMPLDSLRAKGLIGEIRTRELQFTLEETAAYLSKAQFALMGQSALPLLEERFEGWPAGRTACAQSARIWPGNRPFIPTAIFCMLQR
jgi:ATP/maltotriose-dependent transcriptional regulator MalT